MDGRNRLKYGYFFAACSSTSMPRPGLSLILIFPFAMWAIGEIIPTKFPRSVLYRAS